MDRAHSWFPWRAAHVFWHVRLLALLCKGTSTTQFTHTQTCSLFPQLKQILCSEAFYTNTDLNASHCETPDSWLMPETSQHQTAGWHHTTTQHVCSAYFLHFLPCHHILIIHNIGLVGFCGRQCVSLKASESTDENINIIPPGQSQTLNTICSLDYHVHVVCCSTFCKCTLQSLY